MRLAALAAVLVSVACTRTLSDEAPAPKAPVAPAEGGRSPDAAGPAVAPLVARADAAIADLQATLGKRLTGRLAEAGPAGAVQVCAVEAQDLAAAVGGRHGVSIGRTAARLRSPRNAPRPWVQPWLDRYGGGKASDARAEVHDLGDRVGVIRPIAVGPTCVLCHGALESIDPATRAILGERYPTDAAVGFAEGDLRGAFWVEVSKGTAPPEPEANGGPAD